MSTTLAAPATATENHLSRRAACPSGAAAGADQLAPRAGQDSTARADHQRDGRSVLQARETLTTSSPTTCAPAYSFAYLNLGATQDHARPVGRIAANWLERGTLPEFIQVRRDEGPLFAGEVLRWSPSLRGWSDKLASIVACAYQVRAHWGKLYEAAPPQQMELPAA